MGKEMEPGVESLLSKQSPGPPASLVGSTQLPKKKNASQTFPKSWRSEAASKLSIASAVPDTKAKKDIMDKQRGQVIVSDGHRCQSPLQTNKVRVNSQWKVSFTMIKWDLCLTYQDGLTQAKGWIMLCWQKEQTNPTHYSLRYETQESWFCDRVFLSGSSHPRIHNVALAGLELMAILLFCLPGTEITGVYHHTYS